MHLAAALALATAALLNAACASAGAGADAGLETRSYAASGGVSADRVQFQDLNIEIQQWPSGMEKWSPEQLAAFVDARAKAGPAIALGEVLAVRQDVKVGTDQASRGGAAEGGRGAGNPVLAADPAALAGAARSLRDALGSGTSAEAPPKATAGAGATKSPAGTPEPAPAPAGAGGPK